MDSPFLGAGGFVGFEDHLEAGRLKELHAATRVHRLRNSLVAQPQPPLSTNECLELCVVLRLRGADHGTRSVASLRSDKDRLRARNSSPQAQTIRRTRWLCGGPKEGSNTTCW